MNNNDLPHAAEAAFLPATCSALVRGSVYFPLFEHMSREHNVTLLDSELAEIIRVAYSIYAPAERPSEGRG